MEFNERWSLVPLHNNHGTPLLSKSKAGPKLASAVLMTTFSDRNSISVYRKYAPQVIQSSLFLYYSSNSNNITEYFSNDIENPYCYHYTIY